VALFVLLPFAYLFCESEGLPFLGNKRVIDTFKEIIRLCQRQDLDSFSYYKGLIARAKETMVNLTLISLIILGIMYVVAALIDRDKDSIDRIFRKIFYLTIQ